MEAGNQLIKTLQGGLGHHTFVGRSVTAVKSLNLSLIIDYLLNLPLALTDDFLLSVILGSISICVFFSYSTSNCISILCHKLNHLSILLKILSTQRYNYMSTSTASCEICKNNNVV